MTATDAQPRSVGEILNRAIATYGRRFAPLFVILAVFAIPAGVLSASSGPSFAHVVQTLAQIGSLPASDTVDRLRLMNELNRSAWPGGWLMLDYLFGVIFYPLAQTAFIVYAADVLDGAAPTIAPAYREAVRRWLPQIVVAIAFLALGFVLALGFGVVVSLLNLVVSAVASLSPAAAAVAGIILGLGALAVLSVGVALGYIAWLMSAISVAVEDGNPVRAIGRGARRTLDRPLLRRTLAVALAVIALGWFATLAIMALAALVDDVTRLTLLFGIVAASAAAILDGVRIVFVLLYTRDVQLRREGSDLMLAAALMTPLAVDDERGDGLDRSDRALIAQFLARRATLDPQAAAEIAARIAERVRPKLRASFHYLNDVDLLEHLGR